jgi:hypothetical protein
MRATIRRLPFLIAYCIIKAWFERLARLPGPESPEHNIPLLFAGAPL